MTAEIITHLEDEVRRLETQYHAVRREYHDTGEALKAARKRLERERKLSSRYGVKR